MISISLQRKDKEFSDKVSYTDDTITFNGVEYNFEKGISVDYVSPIFNMICIRRNDAGELEGTVIMQYNDVDKSLAESDKEAFILQQHCETIDSTVNVEFITFTEEELIEQELAEVEAEMQVLREVVRKQIEEERIDEILGV